jgi:hypothetical protein
MSQDIMCPRCCEPWGIDTLHEYVSEYQEMFPRLAGSMSFRTVYETFKRDGCGVAFDAWEVSCEPDTSGRGLVFAELADVFGDDVDGFASFCEDFGGVL